MIDGLKPCPFCGNDAPELVKLELTIRYKVHCDECGASSYPKFTKQEAVEAWNRRADNG